ncbi:MAG: hypothetical protein ABR512_03130 [Desulfopila sp.]
MNTFFYAASSARCRDNCNYKTCSRRCLFLLNQIAALQDLYILPGGSKLQTPNSMKLRSGDVVILYAEDQEDIDSLVALENFFGNFRIIFIAGTDSLLESNRHHSLTPRYTMVVDQGLEKVGAVIDRLCTQTHPSPSTESSFEGYHYG